MQDTLQREPSSVSQALSGIRIIDLTQNVAGPHCTKLLADHGADVIKVEPPDGDTARTSAPFFKDQPHAEHSGLFLHLNTSKRGITVNLSSSTGRKIVEELAVNADALVEDLGPGGLESIGLSYEGLKALNPRLVVTSISPFGLTGPYRDFKVVDMMYYGIGGPLSSTGDPERAPMRIGDNVSLYQAGAAAAVATMMALYAAEMRGEGDHIDMSIMETQQGSIDRRASMLLGYSYTGVLGGRVLDVFGIGTGPHPCMDGWVNTLGGEFGFEKICSMIGMPELMEDPRFATVQARKAPGAAESFDEYYIPWLLDRTKKEVWSLAQQNRIPSGVINTTEDLLADENFRDRGVWAETDHSAVGRVAMPGRPFIMHETPWKMSKPAPTLGQHTPDVLCGELGYSREEVVQLRRSGAI